VRFIDFDELMYDAEVIGPNDRRHSNKYKHGFAISVNGMSVEFYTKDKAAFEKWIEVLKKFCVFPNFDEKYTTMDLLGTGGYGKVRESFEVNKFLRFLPLRIRKQGRSTQENLLKCQISRIRKDRG